MSGTAHARSIRTRALRRDSRREAIGDPTSIGTRLKSQGDTRAEFKENNDDFVG